MKAISIREIPDSVHAALREMAAHNSRSLQQQIKMILEKESKLHKIGALNRAKNWRQKLKDRGNWGNIADEIRESRENR